jgi:small neutral amino acid transporter SnatA (MarC family)
MDVTLSQAIVILLLVMDPVGNVPLFVSLLAPVDPQRRARVIVRECAIAFGVLLAFLFAGKQLLVLLDLSESSLNIAGGVILFLIALRMIFRTGDGVFGDTLTGEPFIVPLAVPSVAGPAAIATVVLLLFSDQISRRAGARGLLALERLMGLILTAIAVEMLLRGVETFLRQLHG